MPYYVYMHCFPNHKVYIGVTGKEKLRDRWHGGKAYFGNKYLTNAINKYGWENIKHFVVYEGLTREDALEKEKELIALFNSTVPEYGYNKSKGGESNTGYKHSQETKDKIRRSLQGVKHSEERRQRQRESRLKLWQNEEFRKKESEAHKGKLGKDNPSSKLVFQYTTQGELLNIYYGCCEVQRKMGFPHQQISVYCNMAEPKAYKGFIWRYEKNKF